jgi:hypothetical protein
MDFFFVFLFRFHFIMVAPSGDCDDLLVESCDRLLANLSSCSNLVGLLTFTIFSIWPALPALKKLSL